MDPTDDLTPATNVDPPTRPNLEPLLKALDLIEDRLEGLEIRLEKGLPGSPLSRWAEQLIVGLLAILMFELGEMAVDYWFALL